MRKGKGFVLVLAAVLILALALAAAGCGSSSNSSSSSSSSASATSPADAMAKILGHAPTGLAKTIVDRGNFTVVDDANYPPQSYIDKSGKLIGFDVDVAKRLSQILGVPAKIITAPWASVLSGIPVDRFDVSIGSMTITTDREKSMAFSDPYYYTQAQVIVKQGSPILDSLASMKGKTIGVGTGTTYDDFLDKAGGITGQDLRHRRLDLPGPQERPPRAAS